MASLKNISLALALSAPLFLAQAQGAESEITLDINGEVHALTLSDFQEGEVRSFEDGAHTLTVTREGDNLKLMKDGEALGEDIDIEAILKEQGIEDTDGAHHVKKAVFISSDGEQTDLDIEALAGDMEWEESESADGTKKITIVNATENEGEAGVEIEKDVKVIVIKKESVEE